MSCMGGLDCAEARVRSSAKVRAWQLASLDFVEAVTHQRGPCGHVGSFGVRKTSNKRVFLSHRLWSPGVSTYI